MKWRGGWLPGGGFSLIEMLISTAILLAVTAVTAALAVDAQRTWRADNARLDLQQRGRVVADTLARALFEAGAGPQAGTARGPLLRALAPVLPRRTGIRRPDPAGTFRTDAFTVMHALAEAEHTALAVPVPASTSFLEIVSATCSLPACGFSAGSTAMVLDGTGNYDLFTVTDVLGTLLSVRHQGAGNAVGYPAGAPVLHVESRTFYLDPASRILRVYDGDASDLPVADDVVRMAVEYLGDALPPALPRPAQGQANCLYNEDGTYRLSVLPLIAAPASLVDLDGASLTDGPWCGSGGNQFDADLLRLRRIRVTLRLQASDPAVRAVDPARFQYPGTARSSAGIVPDSTLVVDVTPRNLHQGW